MSAASREEVTYVGKFDPFTPAREQTRTWKREHATFGLTSGAEVLAGIVIRGRL